jgi:hypothetical protein
LAEREVETLAETIDQSDFSERDQAAELLHNFLIPEVLRTEQRSTFDQNREARLEAARALLFKDQDPEADN